MYNIYISMSMYAFQLALGSLLVNFCLLMYPYLEQVKTPTERKPFTEKISKFTVSRTRDSLNL